MKTRTFLLLLFMFMFAGYGATAGKIKILIVTGGHTFDRDPFFEMFDSFGNLTWTELVHPEAREQLKSIDLETFDAVVFYDMPKTLTEQEKEAYYRLLKAGKGLLFLHHAVCAYQEWPEYKYIVGGKYYEKKRDDKFGASSYLHDVDFEVNILKPSHQVTKKMNDFVLHDEVYGNLEVLPEVTPLLSTRHPKSNMLIGWTLKKENSKIVYIQPGHDNHSYSNPNYRNLVYQSINYITAK